MNAVERAAAGYELWDANAYLRDYYTRVEADEEHTIAFLVRAFAAITPGATALEFGAGPTIHHLLPLAPHCADIHVADFLPVNLAAIRDWWQQRPGAHDWRAFTRQVLRSEGMTQPLELDIRRRETLTRTCITRLLGCDVHGAPPLAPAGRSRYDLVVSCYCVECASAEIGEWRRNIGHLLGLLEPGGLFVTAALRRCRRYRVGPHWFPCADIDETDIAIAFDHAGLSRAQRQIEVHAVAHLREHGYESIVLACCRA